MIRDNSSKSSNKEEDVVMHDSSWSETEVINFTIPKRKRVDGPSTSANGPNSETQTDNDSVSENKSTAGSARQARPSL